MKKIFILAAAFMLTVSAFAQSPEKMSYQAVVRNSTDNLVASQTVGFQISVLQGSTTGTAVYEETQTPTTNINGLVSLEIGTGTLVSGDFSAIDWSNGPFFIKTETDPTGGASYTITGTSQLMSVPYALHAKTAESVTGGITETDPVYTASEAANITANNITVLSNTSGTNTGDQDISGIATNAGDITTNTIAIALNTAKTGITTAQASEITVNTAKNSEADGTSSGDMKYWNGSAWVMIPTTVNEGATLQMINGVPTWTGGTPLIVGSLIQGGIVYQIFQPGDAGYVVGETHGMVASATQGQSNYANAQAFINTLNTGTYSNWTLPNWTDQGPIRSNLITAGADLNFILNDDHWAGDIISSANWVFNIHSASGYSPSSTSIHSVFGKREF
tara:strand:- start:497 stop:1669 length:1173 start_codon:yes stop_codon:yes gene_type:complete